MKKAGNTHVETNQDSKGKQRSGRNQKRLVFVAFSFLMITSIIVASTVFYLNVYPARWNAALLEGGPDLLKICAAKRLGDAGGAEAVPALLDAVTDDNLLVSLAAIKALGNLGDMSAFEPMAGVIEKAMEDGHIDAFEKRLIRITLLSMLKIVGRNSTPDSDSSGLHLFASGLSSDVCMDFLRFVDEQRRSYCPSHSNGEFDPDSAAEYKKFKMIIYDNFVAALKDENPNVRYIALWYLQREEDSYPDIARLLDDENDSVRLFAVLIIGGYGGGRAIDTLVEFLDYDDPKVHIICIEKLGVIKSDQAMAVLLELLDEDDGYKREAAIYALGRQEDTRAIEPVLEYLEDPNPSIRGAAINALWAMGEHDIVLETVEELAGEDAPYSIPLHASHTGYVYDRFYERIYYDIEDELEERLARRSFLDAARKTSFASYGDWVADWILQGGDVDCGYPYNKDTMDETMYILSDGAVITPLYGASSVTLIAPREVSFTIDGLGHNVIYYWDEDGNARKKGHERTVVITSDVMIYLEVMNNPRINEALAGCDDD